MKMKTEQIYLRNKPLPKREREREIKKKKVLAVFGSYSQMICLKFACLRGKEKRMSSVYIEERRGVMP